MASDDERDQKVQREALLRDHANRLALARMRVFHPYWLEYLQKRAREGQKRAHSVSGPATARTPRSGRPAGASSGSLSSASDVASIKNAAKAGSGSSSARAQGAALDALSAQSPFKLGGSAVLAPRKGGVFGQASDSVEGRAGEIKDGALRRSEAALRPQSARLEETPRSKVSFGDAQRPAVPATEVDDVARKERPRSSMRQGGGARTGTPSRELRFEGAHLEGEKAGGERARVLSEERGTPDGRGEGRAEDQPEKATTLADSTKRGFEKGSGFPDVQEMGDQATPTNFKPSVKEKGALGFEDLTQPEQEAAETSGVSNTDAPTPKALSLWAPRNNSLKTNSVLSAKYIASLSGLLLDLPSETQGEEDSPHSKLGSRPNSRGLVVNEAGTPSSRPRSRGFWETYRPPSSSRPESRDKAGSDVTGGVNAGSRAGEEAPKDSVNPQNRPGSREGKGLELPVEEAESREGKALEVPVEEAARPPKRLPDSEPQALPRIESQLHSREKLSRSNSRRNGKPRSDSKQPAHSLRGPPSYLPSTNRKHPWQLGWDALMRQSVVLEAKALPDGTCPLRNLYDSFRKEGETRVAIDALRKGMR
jgi:hypothetical protein